jgi:hypothetical protein
VNISDTAAIVGTKLGDGTMPGTVLQPSTLTVAKMNAASVPKHYVDSATGSQAMTTSSTFVDIPGITQASLTPGSTSDMIVMHFAAVIADAAGTVHHFGFSVDGTDTDDLIAARPSGDLTFWSLHAQWSVLASGTSAIVIKPRYRKSSGPNAPTFELGRVFLAYILPGK